MALVLGIDTGGTYTDSVIMDSVTGEIVSGEKALTTKDNLQMGIRASIMKHSDISGINSVVLSTTLATNKIVEGKGDITGLIYMGELEPENNLCQTAVKINGRLDIMGNEKTPVLKSKVMEAAEIMINAHVKAIAVSGYGSTRNPKHEKQVKSWLAEKTNLPVVCGYELTSALGFEHRTVTAILNASLIPVINRLLDAVKEVMNEFEIDAPLFIVKGDGTLMNEEFARNRPIESILSGPAASIKGGSFLSRADDAIVVDIGGTTTDVALIEKGNVNIKKEGAKVGGLFTRVAAAQISTFPFGGDSHIRVSKTGEILVGPEKVYPVSYMCDRYPYLENELKHFNRNGEYKAYFPHEAESYILNERLDKSSADNLSEIESLVIDALKDGPHSIDYLAKRAGVDGEVLNLEGIVSAGYIHRIGFTPTDLLHVKGTYREWNSKAAIKMAGIIADRLEISADEFISRTEKIMHEKMASICFQSCLDFEGVELNLDACSEGRFFVGSAIGNNGKLLDIGMKIKKPILLIGAPAPAWKDTVARLTGTEVIIPTFASVANAVGAAVCKITEKIEMTIIKKGDEVLLMSSEGRHVYSSEEECMFYAVHLGRKEIEHRLQAAGVNRWEITEEMHCNKENTYKTLIITGVGI